MISSENNTADTVFYQSKGNESRSFQEGGWAAQYIPVTVTE